MSLCATVSLLFCFLARSTGLRENIAAVIEQKEDFVKWLSKEAARLHENRLIEVEYCSCALHTCSYDYIAEECHTDLLNYSAMCGFNCEGRKLNYRNSVIFTPSQVDIRNLTTEEKVSVCAFQSFGNLLRDLYPNDVVTPTYFGMKNGVCRLWPAIARLHTPDGDPSLDGCRYFDPTVRPWYTASSTGPKNIIFVIDHSESMNELRVYRNTSKWEDTVDAISVMIDTLGITDYFNVVTFAEKATEVWKETNLVQATNEHKRAVLKALTEHESPQTLNGSNFTAAFSKAFDLLTKGCKKENCSACETVIVFLTDGKDQTRSGGLRPSEITSAIEERQKEFKNAFGTRASIFTYSLGVYAEDSVLKQIACQNNGSNFFIRDDENVLSILKEYYLFFAGRVSDRVVWSEPYVDDITGANITSVATPVYTTGANGTLQEFLGVVGHDVFLFEFGEDEEESRQEILSRNKESSKCDPLLNGTCQLQIFRNELADGATCVDRFPIEITPKDDPQCFTNGKSFYKRFSALVEWDKARLRCEADGGQLVSIGSDKELEFVASMASDDGSWIGLRRQEEVFSWIDEDLSNLDLDSYYFAIDQNPYPGDCVTVDSRGPIRNLNLTRCENEFSFICKYNKNNSCKGEILNPEDMQGGFFSVPPLGLCSNQNKTDLDLLVYEAASSLDSFDVICPFRKPRTDFEATCCDECQNLNLISVGSDNDSELNSETKALIAITILLGLCIIALVITCVLYRRA